MTNELKFIYECIVSGAESEEFYGHDDGSRKRARSMRLEAERIKALLRRRFGVDIKLD